jgi:hypothetical protein
VDWSWVKTLAEVDDARAHARRLADLKLAVVRYYDLDYLQPDRPDGVLGARLIADEDEWRQPTWRFPFGDSVDYGVELETACGRCFTVSWDSPGCHEGIWIRESPLVGAALAPEANVAVWDVSHAGRWDQFAGQLVSDVRLAYKPWAKGDGYWCSRITLTIVGCEIQMVLGDAGPDNRLRTSADNIAVLFPTEQLPDWERQ